MPIISRDIIDTIRQRCDIVEVVASYIPLQRAGSAFKALCPFHREKTPSFFVNPSRQIYHCFGCGAGGDVIRFVMDYEKVPFVDAVRMLAERVGVELRLEPAARAAESRRQALFRLHEAAARRYQEWLKSGPGSDEARAYLDQRQIPEAARARFRIGWAPDAPTALLDWAGREGFDRDLLEEAGLLVRVEGTLRDRFRKRIMFPICDEQGRVVAFSGRVLRAEDHPAKYLNSPETPLFSKGRILYALDQARRSIAEQRRAILCEGQIDALRCHLAGLTNVVAVQGTAVTEEHARTLRRYAEEVLVMLDADSAGQDAAIRTAKALMSAGLVVQLARLPAGEDPDSLILRRGVQAVQEVLDRAMGVVEFIVQVARDRGELATETGRRRTITRLVEAIAAAPSPVWQEDLLRAAATQLRVSMEALHRELDLWRRTQRAPPEPLHSTPTPASAPTSKAPAEERQLLEIALHHPETRTEIREYVPPRLITHEVLREIFQWVLSSDEAELPWPAEERPAEWDRWVAELEMSDRARALGRLPESSAVNAARQCIVRLWEKELARRQRELQLRAAAADASEQTHISEEMYVLAQQMITLRRGWDAARTLISILKD